MVDRLSFCAILGLDNQERLEPMQLQRDLLSLSNAIGTIPIGYRDIVAPRFIKVVGTLTAHGRDMLDLGACVDDLLLELKSIAFDRDCLRNELEESRRGF